MLENVEEFILFAAMVHKNQNMFEPEVPYLTHIFGVVNNVFEAYVNGIEKFDIDYAVKVAILHDTIEDTDVSYEEICDKFGEEIAVGVLALTKNEKLAKEDRMYDSIERIKKCRKEIAIVKLADRTFNMEWKPKGWSSGHAGKYLSEAVLIKEELGKYNGYLKNKLEDRIKRY